MRWNTSVFLSVRGVMSGGVRGGGVRGGCVMSGGVMSASGACSAGRLFPVLVRGRERDQRLNRLRFPHGQ